MGSFYKIFILIRHIFHILIGNSLFIFYFILLYSFTLFLLSDALISFFIKVIDFIVFILDKFHNKSNLDNDNGNELNEENNSEDEFNLTNEGIFKLNDLLKNDSIFEELENRYSKESSSNGLNSSNQSQNIFSSLIV